MTKCLPIRPASFKRSPARWVVVALAAAVPLFTCHGASAATPKEVDQAIAMAVKYLYQVEQGDNWELVPQPINDNGADVKGKQWGGLTAMATYALLAAGEKAQDPRVAQAITWLLKADNVSGTYAVGLRAQVWQFLPERHPQRSLVKAAIKRDRDLLLNGMHQDKQGAENFGFYGYFPQKGGGYDRSNSQYAVLGMWAAEQAGAEVPNDYWRVQDQVWKKSQNQDGGWSYNGGKNQNQSTSTMTAAGVATLFITQDYLLDLKKDCQGNVFNQNIEMGLAFMDRHVRELLGGSFYGMYGVERIGVASGRKYFGALDWYHVGADSLVKSQKPDGAWGDANDHDNARKVPNTCFALYFLTRGRAPVLMSKLEYESVARGGKDAWNQRPRDLANFSRWMTRNLDNKYTNWQIVNLKVEAHELHDAPILYIAGGEAPTLNNADVDKLRQFVEQGGLILGNADCVNPKFVSGFRALARKLFPRYEFRDLEQTHPILVNQQFNASKWKRRPKVLGLSNGVRELMVLLPNDDLSKAWQTHSDKIKEELFQFASNLYLYSVKENTVRTKGETYIVQDNGKGKPERAMKVARLIVGDNPDPEPGGWRRLANVMKNASMATVTTEPVKAGEGKLKGFKVAHWTGTTKAKLPPKARDEIVEFVNGGGTLLVDSAGGSSDFADAAADALAEMFGGAGAKKQLTQPLPPTHALYTMPGVGIEKFAYRRFAAGRVVGRLNVPRLAGIDVGGRLAVLFSREDLSTGLVGVPVDGILGYDADTATALVRNVLVYAETGGKGLPPPPKEKDGKDEGKDEKGKPKQGEASGDKPAPERASGKRGGEAAPARKEVPESNRTTRAAPPTRAQRRGAVPSSR